MGEDPPRLQACVCIYIYYNMCEGWGTTLGYDYLRVQILEIVCLAGTHFNEFSK